MIRAEYPGAIVIAADPSNYSPELRPNSDIDRIVIHVTDGHPDPRGTAGMFATPKSLRKPPKASSAHFVIGQDGTVIQCVPISFAAYHAHSANARSIAIEHSARTPREWGADDPGLAVSDAQYMASALLVRFLCDLCKLSRTRDVIVGHTEIDPETDHTDCPNAIWNWVRYMALLTTG